MVKNPPGSPKETSTPNSRVVRGRKNIHDNDVLSPIKGNENFFPYISESCSAPDGIPDSANNYQNSLNNSSPRLRKSNGRSETDSDELSESEENQQEVSNASSRQSQIPINIIGVLSILFVVLAVVGYVWSGDESLKEHQQTLQEKFDTFEKEIKNQNEDFWRSIKVSINEVPVLKQPRTIIFLYEEKSEKTLNKILDKVIEAASCFLSECTKKPIHIRGASLNTTEIIKDHGVIITKYREQLEKSCVMAVHNLEQVPGQAALAFHSFCDDYNPIVEKSLILFTLKVDKLPEGYPMMFLEKFLLNLWKDIGRGDKFHPLFTRISGNVLTVRPE